MKVRLNPEAVDQLTSIMDRMGYTNVTHCVQVMISSTYNNLYKKHKSPNGEDNNHGKTSKTVRNM